MKILQIMIVLLSLGWILPLKAQGNYTAYDLALQRIEEATLTGATELDLSDSNLAELPPEIGQLSNLESLNLWDNQLNSLPSEIGQLINLQHLDLGANQLRNLPEEIWELRNLKSLILYSNELTEFPSNIGQLSDLEYLNLGYNGLSSVPSEIGHLNALERLDLGHNQLSSIPFDVGLLDNLCAFDVGFNNLTSLPDLGDLDKFTEYINSEHCSRIISGVRFVGNPLKSPPQVVVDSGSEAILAYLSNPIWWHLQRIIVVVVSGSGLFIATFLALRWHNQRRHSKKRKRG